MTEPPPRANFSATANQMEIYDCYVEDLAKQVWGRGQVWACMYKDIHTHTNIRTYMDWVEVCTCLSVCLSVCLPVYLKAKEKEKKGSKPGKDEDKPNLKKSAGELPVVRAD